MSSTTSATANPSFTPALKPPAGVQSNPEHPESLAYLSHVTVAIYVPIVTIFFFARVYVRIFIKKTWTFEDWLVFVAWGGTVAYGGILIATMSNHGGQHLWDITKTQAMQASYWFWIASIEYGIWICIVKIAVLVLYRRVFIVHKWSAFDIETLILIAIFLGFYIGINLAKIFECTPHARIFDKTVPGTCIDVATLLNTSGLFNTITDFIILLMPAQALWGLKMNLRKKMLMMLVFTFGLCGPVFSTIGYVVRVRNSNNPDTSWNQPEILLWGAAELATGNLIVCFPELGVLFRGRAAQRSNKPTTSVLNGARAAIANSRRSAYGNRSKGLFSQTTEELNQARDYVELDDEIGGNGASHRTFATSSHRTENDIPMNSIVVETHIDVASSKM